ncbi:hypothetical protein PO909_032466 [Leuciscus waleckii]
MCPNFYLNRSISSETISKLSASLDSEEAAVETSDQQAEDLRLRKPAAFAAFSFPCLLRYPANISFICSMCSHAQRRRPPCDSALCLAFYPEPGMTAERSPEPLPRASLSPSPPPFTDAQRPAIARTAVASGDEADDVRPLCQAAQTAPLTRDVRNGRSRAIASFTLQESYPPVTG